MLKQPVYITGLFSISALGTSDDGLLQKYQSRKHYLSQREINGYNLWLGELSDAEKKEINRLKQSDSKYKNLDNSVLYAMYAAREALAQAKWGDTTNFGINIGSSRGATSLFEKYHDEFLETGTTSTRSSPTTTMGNISSWVAHDLKSRGPAISHSITCSTALHALLNGVAWIQSGLANKFLVGGSEAPLTSFTFAQMQALKIYSQLDEDYPCRSLDLTKEENTMVLGEASAIACLENNSENNPLAEIVGIGYATEPLQHGASLSSDAKCFQDSMQMALGTKQPNEVDVIVMHAPGTIQGDISEYKAVKTVFGKNLPLLTTNKWMLGHTFGASGMLSIEMAILMLQYQVFLSSPFYEQNQREPLQHIMVNAVGFGGNAVSILLRKKL